MKQVGFCLWENYDSTMYRRERTEVWTLQLGFRVGNPFHNEAESREMTSDYAPRRTFGFYHEFLFV